MEKLCLQIENVTNDRCPNFWGSLYVYIWEEYKSSHYNHLKAEANNRIAKHNNPKHNP